MGTGLEKGDFVQNISKNRGVVESLANEGTFAYVSWFMSYDAVTGAVRSYLEYISINYLLEVPKEEIHVGLEALRRKIVR